MTIKIYQGQDFNTKRERRAVRRQASRHNTRLQSGRPWRWVPVLSLASALLAMVISYFSPPPGQGDIAVTEDGLKIFTTAPVPTANMQHARKTQVTVPGVVTTRHEIAPSSGFSAAAKAPTTAQARTADRGETARPIPTAAASTITHGHVESAKLQPTYLRPVQKPPADAAYPRWALLAWNDRGRNTQLESVLSKQVAKSGIPAPVELFSSRFLRDGLAERIWRGEEDLISTLGIDQHIEFLVLAKSEERLLPEDSMGIRTVYTTIQLQFIAIHPYLGTSFLTAADGAAGYNTQNANDRAFRAALQPLENSLVEFFYR